MKKILIFISLFTAFLGYSQKERRVITTAVPFLMISSDARASGIGEQGVATSFDNFSQTLESLKIRILRKFLWFWF